MVVHCRTLCSVVLIGAGIASSAAADEAGPATSTRTDPPTVVTATPPGDARPKAERSWYGWQILLVDVGSLALAGGGFVGWIGTDSPGPFIALLACGSLAYGVSSPVVHALHGNMTTSWVSLALHWGTALLDTGFVFLAGYALAPAIVFIAPAILLIPSTIEAAALAYEMKLVTPTPRGSSWLTPTFNLPKGGATLGIAGDF